MSLPLPLVARRRSGPDDHSRQDALVIPGGEHDALDDAGSPWFPTPTRLARSFGEADKAVLGVCLGAQFVARGDGALADATGLAVARAWVATIG